MKERQMPTGFQGPEKREIKEVKYQLMYNAAAGECRVNELTRDLMDDSDEFDYRTQDGYFQEVGIFDSEEELNKAIKKLAGETVFAVFENDAAGEVYISEENNLTGNWRGSRNGHAHCAREFKTREAAERYVKQVEEYYAKS